MIVLVDVKDNRYASGLRVRTWNVEKINTEIYEYVSKHKDKINKIWFGDNLYSNSAYSPPGSLVDNFLEKYSYLEDNL